MVGKYSLAQAGVLLSLAVFGTSSSETNCGASVQCTCEAIAAAISSASDVYYPPSVNYTNDNAHWASSSSENSTCSVEPGTAEDVGTILKIVGASRTPFGVKGGGHAINPGFSATTGIQIAMTRFSNVTYNKTAQTADIGAGLYWDDVYEYLAPYNVNVVGGRISGVGVAGFTLGGGYSWKTSQYGLTLDTVQAFELVLPNGTLTTVTATDVDLFFGLKGGFNNFGIVTKFTLKTFPQTEVWGGSVTITADYMDELNAAVANYSANVTDPKAAIIPTYNYLNGTLGVSLLCFYDSPTYPDGIFDQLMAVPSAAKNISTRSFLSLVQSAPGLSDATGGLRGVGTSISVLEVTPALLEVTVNETKFWGEALSNSSETFLSYDVEPFLSTLFTHGAPSAYPPDRSRGLLPFNIFYGYSSAEFDDVMRNASEQSAARVLQAVEAEGQNVANASVYGNYASADTPLSEIYGANVARLHDIRVTVDPEDVMGLAGGFKF